MPRTPTGYPVSAIPSQPARELFKFTDRLPCPDFSPYSLQCTASGSPLGNPRGIPNYHAQRRTSESPQTFSSHAFSRGRSGNPILPVTPSKTLILSFLFPLPHLLYRIHPIYLQADLGSAYFSPPLPLPPDLRPILSCLGHCDCLLTGGPAPAP